MKITLEAERMQYRMVVKSCNVCTVTMITI